MPNRVKIVKRAKVASKWNFFPAVVELNALCKMVDRGQITGAIVDGPLAFDNCHFKRCRTYQKDRIAGLGRRGSPVGPNLEAGNILFKQLQYLAGALAAGVVVGARFRLFSPVALTANWLEWQVVPLAFYLQNRAPA